MAVSRPASPTSFAAPCSHTPSRNGHRLSCAPSLDLTTKRSMPSTSEGLRSSGLLRAHEPPSPTGLLPSFAQGRMLPPPVPTASFDSDPRAYSSASPQTNYTHLRPIHSANNGTGTSFAKPRAPSPARSGGKLSSIGPSQPTSRLPPPTTTNGRPSSSSSGLLKNGWSGVVPTSQTTSSRIVTGPAHLARPPSPLRHAHSFHSLPNTVQRVVPESTAFARPASLASHRPVRPSHSSSRFHPPPLNMQASMSSLRRKASQIELDSPTTASQPPSPAAPAHFSMTDRHRTPRSNQDGYRNLVRRASTSEFGAVKMEINEDASMAAAPPRPPSRSSTLPGTANRGDYSILRRGFPAQVLSPHSVHHFFPPDDPRIAPPADAEIRERDGQAGQPNKRTIFSPYELSVLHGLWAAGAYYPASHQVEEVQRRTGLSRLQVRNWFANKRQRATGDEKSRVIEMGKGLSAAY